MAGKHQMLAACFALTVLLMFDKAKAKALPPPLTNASGPPTTDPSEARALNSIFARWRISAAGTGWNISGELCSGTALTNILPTTVFPNIACDCSFNRNTTCHITGLDVFSMAETISSARVIGPLPEELWSLTYLTYLRLGHNYLTGSIPPSIGNLTRMQHLYISVNALTGHLPPELGQLTNLLAMSIGTNNFMGALPDELGNCTRLRELYIESSGISGAIPSTFANLRNMEIMAAWDIELTGHIPDFIGSWSKLTYLRLEGHSLQGPIPPTLSALTSLRVLVLSDIHNASSHDFLANMTHLTQIIMVNNSFSGSIVSSFYQYPNLTLLNLSFNMFTGPIPSSLFKLSALGTLILGSNRLSGSLPEDKNPNLQMIDLSYNELSGSFPSWVNQKDLQINLVANNFTMQSTNFSGMPSGLDCLQRSFPCYQEDHQYSNFAISCGGQQYRSVDGILYEADNVTLGSATYYVTKDKRWAVSNVGVSQDLYIAMYDSVISNINVSTTPYLVDPQLSARARLSHGSLRYYGLGLQNGNYNVVLEFVETIIQDGLVWQALGRRIFDIYIQGVLQLRDFDIRKEAGGRSNVRLGRAFIASVTANHLEIHLMWAGKGTWNVPYVGSYGASISTIHVTPSDFIPAIGHNTTNSSNDPVIGPRPGSTHPSTKNHWINIIVSVVSVGGIIFLFSGIIFLVQRRKRQKISEDEEFLCMEAAPYTFSYSELRAATSNFSIANKLGQGGFGPVYKGTLEDGRVIAVKQLFVASDHGKSQFVAEIATISAVQHRNLVQLYGCCIKDDKRLLVYEYLENSSLDRALYGIGSLCLDWPTRFNICVGVARGLTYLHEESRLRIVHRDVKASNILLDSQLNPKISDFGLAKLYDDDKTHMSTRVMGTIGYLAPEYVIRGHLTEKADVFGFGIVALEIICGRRNSEPNLDQDRIYMLDWVWSCHEKDRDIELVDSNMVEFDEKEVKRVIEVALLCSQAHPGSRPSMSRVVAMLSGDAEISPVTSRPTYLADWNFRDISSSFHQESSRNLTLTATAPVTQESFSISMLLNQEDDL